MSRKQPKRRLVEWQDPAPFAAATSTMSGLELIQAVANGALPPPPIASLIGFDFESATEGRVVLACKLAEYHINPAGLIHGGLAATICDSAMACAVQTLLPAGVGSTTLEIKVNYTRAMTVGTGTVRCVGEVIHIGRTTATAQAHIYDKNDKLYAHATTTCLIFR